MHSSQCLESQNRRCVLRNRVIYATSSLRCPGLLQLRYFFRNLDIDPSAAELHAFDIDLTNLPAEPWLPGIKRHVWNIYDAPPTELVSTFDIVNCQLLYLFVSDETIDKVLGNIKSLLKPGGHIQWFEISAIGEEIISPDPTYKSQYLSRLTNAAFRASGITNRTWPRDLDKVFTRHGLNVVNDHRANVEPRNYKSWTLQFISAHEEVKAHVQRSLKETDTEERRRQVNEYVDLVGQAFWEVHTNKCAYIHPFIRVVGKKEA